ncbi:DNA-binding protein [Ramlibacter terrae]|uniref:DNA-binding protein n=1 Tax=Ramlibacter terrae TaxID=2732511 RepID=A0ABX6P8K4_9BURK|nr:DNA-binding protein [Ramlibacter terrae]
MRELVLRLSPGADLRRAIEAQCREALPEGGFVLGGIGSLQDPVLRLADRDDATTWPGPFEILTLTGTVTPEGAHLHASIASATGQVFGGHVVEGNLVRTAAEVLVVGLAQWRLARELDAGTGYRNWWRGAPTASAPRGCSCAARCRARHCLYACPPGAGSFALTGRHAASSSEKMAGSQKVASLAAGRLLAPLAGFAILALMSEGRVEASNSSRTKARTGYLVSPAA